MNIDLSSVMKSPGGRIELKQAIDLPDLELSSQSFVFTSPLIVTGEVVNTGTVLELTCAVDGTVSTTCARCTKQFTAPFYVELNETLVQQTESEPFQNDDVIAFSGYSISLDEIVTNGILTNLPIRFLCAKDCKGLCSNCGQDQNVGTCDCRKEDVDPRFEVLAKLLDQK